MRKTTTLIKNADVVVTMDAKRAELKGASILIENGAIIGVGNNLSTADEIIDSVKDGIYAVNFSGGQVDITSGQFVFTASEAYKIESGKVTNSIKGMTLIGNGPDVLKKVSMVADDMKLDDGVGTCGKEGQSVPVGVGQPTLKIDDITVGGTEV